jgi:alpha-1,6-mannosyltransferase
VPIIVPADGGAADQLVPGEGLAYAAGDAASAAAAFGAAIDRLATLRAAARLAAPGVRTMDQHFTELFGRYAALVTGARRAA